MQSGSTYTVIKSQGVFQIGMTLTLLGIKNECAYFWSHQPILGIQEVKIDLNIVDQILQLQDYRIINFI